MALRTTGRILGGGTLALITMAVSLGPGSPAHSAGNANFSYTDFSTATGLVLNGNATISGSALRLSDTTTDKTAAAWHSTPVDPAASFESAMRVSLHDGTDPPADGIALVIQSSAAGMSATGRFGEGIGYGGITPSVEVEFDTWLNSWDPDANHVAISTNGDETRSVALAAPPFELYGTPFTAWVSYDAAAKRVAVYASRDSSKPATALVTAELDLGAVLGSSNPAYVGLTSGSGSNGELTDVTAWSFGPAGAVVPAACRVTPFGPKFETPDTATLEVNKADAGDCAYAVVTTVGEPGACPADRAAYRDSPDALKVKYPSIGRYRTKLCVTPRGNSRVTYASLTQTIESPAYTYAPRVFLARGEKYFPDGAENFIANSRLALDRPDLHWLYKQDPVSCNDTTEIESPKPYQLRGDWYRTAPVWKYHGATLFDKKVYCYAANTVTTNVRKAKVTHTGYALQLKPGRSRNGFDPAVNAPSPAYVAFKPGEYIAYWFFYDFNGFERGPVKALHEGDWEHVVVNLDDRDTARTIDYFAHGCGATTVAWNSSKVTKQGTHPVVYSAAGSHAPYPAAGRRKIPACGVGEGLDDRTDQGSIWDTWSNLLNVKDQAWFGYRGGWGASVPQATTDLESPGPVGPNPDKLR